MCSLPPSLRVSFHVATKAAYLFVCLLRCSVMLMWKWLLVQKNLTFVLGLSWNNVGFFAGADVCAAAGDTVEAHRAVNSTAQIYIYSVFKLSMSVVIYTDWHCCYFGHCAKLDYQSRHVPRGPDLQGLWNPHLKYTPYHLGLHNLIYYQFAPLKSCIMAGPPSSILWPRSQKFKT